MRKKINWIYTRKVYNPDCVSKDGKVMGKPMIQTKDSTNQPYHFFGSNVFRWRTSNDIYEVFDYFTNMGENEHRSGTVAFCCNFHVWKVDLPSNAEYEIENYRPIVASEALTYLGQWEIEEPIKKKGGK
tara:strand:- start:350 stop:736 length:387 start_codon:yes stop_codon:yes gene_type:complete